MMKLTGIKRMESIAQNELELNFLKRHIYGNESLEETFNIWLDCIEDGKYQDMKTIYDFMKGLVQLDLDLLQDGLGYDQCIKEKLDYYDVNSPRLLHVESSLLSPIFKDIKFELKQHTEEDEVTYFTVDFKMEPEHELLFKMLGINNYFPYNVGRTIDVMYNGNYE